jgi:3-deoxy-7-phosphoheptulonate synthase
MTWHPTSWRRYPALHQPQYRDASALNSALQELASLPPLVTSWEIEDLRAQIADAQHRRRFLLMGGDCAESFAGCNAAAVTSKLKILLQMSLVLTHGARMPVIRAGRIAGQYAKPRSEEFEVRDGDPIPTYKGDLIHGAAPTARDREPDPSRLITGYERAALTLNFIRSLSKGGFADLHHPEYWDLDFVQHSPMAREFHRIAQSISDPVEFMESVLNTVPVEMFEVDFYTSHEALHLPYEEAQTRQVPRHSGWFNLSTHLPWIGMRTTDPDGAHVEYFRGIRNPIAIKVGPSMTRERLERLFDQLHPEGEPGRLTLIHRFGATQIEHHLPPLIEWVRSLGRPVLFCCDPMHGNTKLSESGIKTRDFEAIRSELDQAVRLHSIFASWLGGVHLELTGENVTECIGGARGLSESDLNRAYQSEVDPRLNYEQAMELAFLLSAQLRATAPRP